MAGKPSRASRRGWRGVVGVSYPLKTLLCWLYEKTSSIELNAMSSPQLVEFVERKLTGHGIKKLVPDDQILDQQARRVIKARLTQKVLAPAADDIQQQTGNAALPEDFRQQVERILKEHPEIPWDDAVASMQTERSCGHEQYS